MNDHLFSPKAILGIVISVLFCSVSAFAQDYVGGSFSFKSNSSRSTASNAIGTVTTWSEGTNINVAPELGWFAGDKWAVGIRPWVGFGSSSANDGAMSRSFSLGVNPYARYQVLAHNRFGLWAEADPLLSFTQNRTETRDHVWISNLRSTTLGVEIVPVLTYQLNRRIWLESRLNLFSLAMQGNHTVSSDGRDQRTFNWGLSATTKDIMEPLGDITIGFLYKF
jgi:hypothetical protein